MATKKAVLRYALKVKDNTVFKRIICNLDEATKLCKLKNMHGIEIGTIYKTEDIVFIANDKNIYLPAYTQGAFVELTPDILIYFKAGQEALKDYIGKNYPDIYLKYFEI